MAKHNYAAQFEKERTAIVVGRSLPISTKHSIELSRFIRNKKIQRAKTMLEQVIDKKLPVPFKRFTELAHKKGHVASGAFPEKAAKEFLKLLNSVESNAQFKGLNTASLVINHICAHKAGKQQHYGRRGREMKKTHVEIVVKETEKKVELKKEDKKSAGKKDKESKIIQTSNKTETEPKKVKQKTKPEAKTTEKKPEDNKK